MFGLVLTTQKRLNAICGRAHDRGYERALLKVEDWLADVVAQYLTPGKRPNVRRLIALRNELSKDLEINI